MRRLANIAWWLSLSAYFGGMLAIGAIVAPVVFQTVRKTGATLPAMPAGVNATDQLGGEIFGNVLARFQTMECICLAIMAIALVMMLMIRRNLWTWLRLAVVVVLAALVLDDMFLATPSILRVREAIRVTNSAEAKATFDGLHRTAVHIAELKLALLFALIIASAWNPPSPAAAPKPPPV